ncbi:DUF447 family protein [Haloferax mediterranei ATCC 33500]|uniref:DUF447 family protein n=1 Tax=Haloferax mediterranei (strain ATCC 33500 / DSM 1411 / JCM 8866 / NBRC 14739 / NCIMB 2177 / R-4) TaxID=523841 RepID=I3R7F5_HALMT|nr:DUF447 domain-containing protein [Haloferax mediterranei]AFK20165.1 hypothetical protein HFX_2482 [Haloferax mediterranei ATCC 33500]AHZ23539.1 hypothetical protein BM92_13210 [Haloferax mediterranei ATCC 33500]ELZ99714.1 hypothetical protein C439_14209 [Haloferax mediterranei ATCC 33500]MDX5987082.1 DUF447 family protein [Haloferax mediterranei ATCC 33500]QCQ76397.1 DUF447 family protein [Haloferax mediterranei ATCC 33500]
MTDEPQSGTEEPTEWPVELRGVTESVVATLGPNDLWNFAALGLHAPESSAGSVPDSVTATTWGNTRTRRNFHRQGGGVVQFVSDPRDFVEAAMTIYERESPVLDSADAWAEVEATMVDSGEDGGTQWETWELHPVDADIERTRPCTINRGFGAVIDATVAASRLDVPAFDTDELLSRLAYFAETVDKCGGPAEREAFARIDELTGWRERAAERRNESF